jgi:hypothetical protein
MCKIDKNLKQSLKKQFFRNDHKLFSKKSKFVSYTCKDTTEILSNIASKPRFTQIKQRYKIIKIISKIVLKSQFNYVLYAFYRKKTLSIATKNHIGQSELNYQKITLLNYFKQIKDFKDIQKVSIFRDENYILSEKNTNQKEKFFKEQSYGIFTNELSNIVLYNITERIRQQIIK